MSSSATPAPGEAEQARARAAARLAEVARETAAASTDLATDDPAPGGPQPDRTDPPGPASAAGIEAPALADPELEELVRRALADLAQHAAAPAVHSPPRLSASQVVAQARDPQAAAIELLRPLPRRPSPAAVRGTAFHAWLETRFESATLLDLEDLADLEDPEEERVLADARALREAFEASDWAHRSPIAVEQPVTTRIGEIGVRGVIDAVFAEPEGGDGTAGPDGTGGVIIVDWKTGRMPRPAQLRERSLQLSLYRLAWHERTGLPLRNIRTAFHFVADGITHEVTEHPSRERIAEMLSGE